MPLTSGSRVGPYEVVSSLGAGGMGEVYRARDTKLGRDVALKVLPAAFAGDPDRLARFEREAKALASLNHPHIAHIYGFEQSHSTHSAGSGQADPEHTGFSALVMELVEGEDLSQRLATGPLPIDEALPIARQIAEALEAAHEQGIVHRDLKPANIKVRPDGTVKVLDFGLAKALEGSGGAGHGWDGAGQLLNSPTITSSAMTERGMILGTAAYMAPEQAKGKPVDRRADIWAFGAVLYEMLTGHRAFPGEDVTDTLAFVITRDPDWTALPASTPQGIRTLLRRCLEKDRKRRLADAGDARLEIDDAMSAPAGTVNVTPLPLAPRKRSHVVAAAAVSAVVFGLAGAFAGRQFTPPLPAAPLTRFAITAPPPQQFRAVGRTVSLSPDGSQMVLALSQGLFVRSMGSLEPRLLAGADSGALNPIFSPDGQSIAYWSSRDLAIRNDSPTAATHVAWFDRAGTEGAALKLSRHCRNPELAPDGGRVAMECYEEGSETRAIWVYDLARDAASRLTVDPDDDADPLWSPDGGSIVFASTRRGPADLFRERAGGGSQEELLLETPGATASMAWSPDGRYIGVLVLGVLDLLTFDTRGDGTLTPIVATSFQELELQFSPDGRFVSYSSDESGRLEIYVQPWPATGDKWQISTDGATDARWRPDGKELFFLSPDRALMAVAIDTSKGFRAGPPTRLFQTRIAGPLGLGHRFPYAVARDGKRFLMYVSTQGAPSTIDVIVNWPALQSRTVSAQQP